ncbi:MAG: DUF3568 family protein [Sedimentisphaerales bacterium]|nr:DUF3568 family protein [Sedimentisphaerales bacterium]
MQTRRMACLCLALTAGLVLSGCASSINDAQGRREAIYEWGTLKATLAAPIDQVYEAAQEALEELELKVLGAERDGIAAELVSRDAQDEQVSIRLEAMPGGRTQLHISVAMFGDKNKSVVLLRRIKDKL